MDYTAISLLALAVVPLLYRAWSGFRYGASVELRYMLTIFFGVLVAVRFWQPVAETLCGAINFDPRLLTIGAFFVLFGLGAMVAGYAVNLRAQFFQSVKANYLNQFLGLAAGLASGGLLAASLLWVACVAIPSQFDSQPEVKKFIDLPRAVFQSVETFMGVGAESEGRTRYPQVSLVDAEVPGGKNVPEGAVLMQRRGAITWQ